MKSSEETIVALQKKGYKRTKNREAILNSIYNSEKPISANDILKKLAIQGFAPNKTTVYRKLDLLKQEGLIREVMINSTTTFYERTDMKHHHHIICVNCQQVTDFHPDSEIEGTLKRVETSLSHHEQFTILQHSLEFFGYCKICSTNV